ncbi:MAG: hypothetical protein ACRD4X_00315 [Candidatus Acidiferrales bacterium]
MQISEDEWDNKSTPGVNWPDGSPLVIGDFQAENNWPYNVEAGEIILNSKLRQDWDQIEHLWGTAKRPNGLGECRQRFPWREPATS